MKKLLIVSTIFYLVLSCNSFADNMSMSENLCSPEGVAKLVPAFRGKDGKFEAPNPLTDMPRFLQAYDGLRNVIAVALTQAQLSASLEKVGSEQYKRFTFSKDWVAAEVGYEAANDKIPDFTKNPYGDYGRSSFLENIVPVAGTNGTLYAIPHSGVFIAPMPTVLKCVNLLMETSSHDSGTFVSPSYALGTKDGKAFMTVNGCQNTSKTIVVNGKKLLTPQASGYLGIQIEKSIFKPEK